MRRVLAVVAAAAMVAGSLALRARLDRTHAEAANPLRLVCAAELAGTCEAVTALVPATTTEPTGTTADRLATLDGDPGLDGWLVPAPWPQIVDGRRQSHSLGPLFGDVGTPLARSPLVLVMWRDRAAALAPRCPGGQPGWRCIGDAATASGLKPGHGNPAMDGLAVLVLGQAVEAFFGRSDLSTVDLDDEGFQQWFTGLERAVPPSPSAESPLSRMLVGGRAFYDVVGTSEAEAGPVLERAAARNDVSLLYPAPMATADVVLATTSGDRGRRLRQAAGGDASRRALAAAGWRVPGQPRPAGEPPLPTTSGLPAPGLLDALRSRAAEATRR